MSLVRIHGAGATVAGSFAVDLVESSQAGKRYGSATFTVPREHPAWEHAALLARGGMLVTIGGWRGVADMPRFTAEGAVISAIDVQEWARMRPVGARRVFRSCSAGVIVRAAVHDAFTGLGVVPVRVGAVVDAPPLIPIFRFNRQPLEQVLSEMQEQTGQVWRVDDERMTFDWQMTLGRYIEDVIVDDGALIPSVQPGSLREQYREVIERDGRTGRVFSAYSGRVPVTWPAVRVEEAR